MANAKDDGGRFTSSEDGNKDAASIDITGQFWYRLVLCQEQRESHPVGLFTTS
jgi:hypothetical protein